MSDPKFTKGPWRFMECSADDTPGAWREFKDSLVVFTDGAKENSSA